MKTRFDSAVDFAGLLQLNKLFLPMKPNVYEYPTNESELPAYRVAVMQDALGGSRVERQLYPGGYWAVDSDPVWDWGTSKFRIQRPKARYFRKSDGLFGPADEQYCVRMLNGVCTFVDVSGDEDVACYLTPAVVEGHVSTGHWIEFDGDMTPWKPKAPPASPVAAGHNPRNLTEEQVGKGYRLLTKEEMNAPKRAGVQYWSDFWGGWDEPLSSRDSHSGVDCYRTNLPVGKYAPSPAAPGHNPEGLTVEQVGEGYRLLTAEEVEANLRHSAKINQKVCTGPRGKPEGIEMWDDTSDHWHPGAWGDGHTLTYRTKKPPGFYLPKPKIAEGHNPAGVTENQIPAGWRLFSSEEFDFLCTTVSYKGHSPRVSGTCFWKTPANQWSDVSEWGLYPSSSGTLITDKPAGFYLPKPKNKVLKPWSLATLKWPDCIRRKGGTTGRNILTSSLQGLWVFYGANQDGRHPLSWQALFDNFEASFDHGQTWVPCGTEEDAS